ncbi:MAG: TonB family protein [Hyphomonadaceae bacterium]|nr:TonB family protein [Hyphomonadaceae bacterium]
MSKDQDHDYETHGATTIRTSKGGGAGGKLLLGAVAAAILLGGGYWAYKNYAQPSDGVQTAYNDSYNAESSYADDGLRAGPIDPSDEPVAETASSDVAPPATTPASSSRSTATPRRVASAEETPEVTIGVTPINATSDDAAYTDNEDLVVTAASRPIWDRTPSARRLSALYPERALERGREGEARLHCTVLEGGALDCARVSETPGGFGPAAVRVARTFRHAPTLSNGADATGSPVNLRVVFRIDDNTRHG